MGQLIEVTMEVVQIVRLSSDAFRRCCVSCLKVREFDNAPGWKEFPWWLARYNELSFPYRRCYCSQLEDMLLEQTDFPRHLSACGLPSMEQVLMGGRLQSHLFYEPHLRQWLLLHQLTFSLAQEQLVDLARTVVPADAEADKRDMYNILRNAFVITGDLDRKADVVKDVEKRAREKITEVAERFYGFSLDAINDIEIVKSAGNITFFFQPAGRSCDLPGIARPESRESRSGYAEGVDRPVVHSRRFVDAASLVPALQEMHERAERIGSTAQPLDVSDTELYLFWGRFHTVVSSDENPVVRFMPAHFQAQLLWSFLSSAELVVQQVESAILEGSLDGDGDSREFIGSLINSIQYAHLSNEDFKRSLEGDGNSVYCPIEERWHLEQTLVHLKEFAAFLSEHLERSFQKSSLIIEERQNKVLFGIGILGIVALIETWGGFLDLMNAENYAGAFEGGPLQVIFASPENLVAFNVLMPLFVVILCVSALVYIFARRGR